MEGCDCLSARSAQKSSFLFQETVGEDDPLNRTIWSACVCVCVCMCMCVCVCVKRPPSARRQTINKTNELMVLQRHGVMAVLQELRVCVCVQERIAYVLYIYESQLIYLHLLCRYV